MQRGWFIYESGLAATAGDVVFVAPNDRHEFRNIGNEPMWFLCLSPNSATGKNVTVVPECGLDQNRSPNG